MNTSTSPLSTLFQSLRKGLPSLDEIQIILNLSDHPAALVFHPEGAIQVGNSSFWKILGYPSPAATHLPIQQILSGFSWPLEGPLFEVQATLCQTNGRKIPVCLNAQCLSANNEWALISLTPMAEIKQAQAIQQQSAQICNALLALSTDLLQTQPLSIVLDNLLKNGSALTSAERLMLYRIEPDQPLLTLQSTFGGEPVFPKSLQITEIGKEYHASIWQPGDVPRSALQRRASAARLEYCAMTAIGQAPNEHIGFLIATHSSAAPIPNLLHWLDILAALITQEIQHQAQTINLNKRVQLVNRRNLFLQTLVDQSSDGIITLGEESIIMDINSVGETMLGYQRSEIVGKHVRQVLVGEIDWDAISHSSVSAWTNVTLLKRNGEGFPALIQCTQPEDSLSKQQWAIILRDQSDFERIQLENNQLQQRAQAGEMLGIFAHEVRNPINNISSGLQLLDVKLANYPEKGHIIEDLVEELDRVSRLVQEMQSLNRTTKAMRPLNINNVLARCLHLWKPRLERKNILWNYRPAPELPKIMGNSDSLTRVFTNLIENAMHAMEKDGGSLGIHTEKTVQPSGNPAIQISIADTGPGIPPENIPHIFDYLFTTKKHGSGLGLAICKRIITHHKGSIQVESNPASNIFRIIIPTISQEGGMGSLDTAPKEPNFSL